MECLKRNVLGVGEELEKGGVGSPTSFDESSCKAGGENAVSGGGAAGGKSSRAGAAAMLEETVGLHGPDRRTAADPTWNVGWGAVAVTMDGVAYPTQPNPASDNSSGRDGSDEGEEDVAAGELRRRRHTRPTRSPQLPRPEWGGTRARKQGDDPLSKLRESPERRQHSSTATAKKNGAQYVLMAKSLQAPIPSSSESQTSPDEQLYSTTTRNNNDSQHGRTIIGKSPEPSSLSQSLVESPLRSPSPPALLHTQPSLPDPTDECSHNNDFEREYLEPHIKPGEASPAAVKDSKLTVSKGATEKQDKGRKVDPVSLRREDDEFGYARAAIDDEMINEGRRRQEQREQLIWRMNAKKQAIYRSLLHLSDNPHTFIYDYGSENNNQKSTIGMNNDDELGLPFIGPGLKDQYEELRLLLRKGLLGYAHDDDGDVRDHSKGKDGNWNTYGEELTDDKNEKDLRCPSSSANYRSNPFIPRVKYNVSAVLMGPRGHGKTLVLERCLASLSRLAGKQKERISEKAMKEQPDMAEEMYSQASFRVVRLNGLLYQGDGAMACREIARQIGVMSGEERRRMRRVLKRTGATRKQSAARCDVNTPKSSKRQRGKEGIATGGSTVGWRGHMALPMAASPVATPLLERARTLDDYAGHEKSHSLRVRQSGFNTYIALLDEVLRTARVDGIPILIVLDELDAFLSGKGAPGGLGPVAASGDVRRDEGGIERQLLLYHILDRVADHKFLVSLVGTTTNLWTVTSFEKRVQSRAQGTSKIIYFGHDERYEDLLKSLLGKFCTPHCMAGKSGNVKCEYDEQRAMIDVRDEVEVILRGGQLGECRANFGERDQVINDFQFVQRVLRRNFELVGSDIRWFCRVFDVALGLLASDIDETIYQCMDDPDGVGSKIRDDSHKSIPRLSPSHVARALVTMSASMEDVSGAVRRPGIPTPNALELFRWGQLLEDPNHYSCFLGTNPRLAALLDLSGPQIAILLAARRIVVRDDTRATAEDEKNGMGRNRLLVAAVTAATILIPLTYERIEDEYTTSFVASGRYTSSSDRYPSHVLYRSCMDLMELDIIRPKQEQRSGGQYGNKNALSIGARLDRIPLHVNLEWELEFMPALKAGLLQCSTALREWGLRVN